MRHASSESWFAVDSRSLPTTGSGQHRRVSETHRRLDSELRSPPAVWDLARPTGPRFAAWGRFHRSWQVLGSNQRRLSRRFHRPLSSHPRYTPLTSTYTPRGGIRARHRPPCVRAPRESRAVASRRCPQAPHRTVAGPAARPAAAGRTRLSAPRWTGHMSVPPTASAYNVGSARTTAPSSMDEFRQEQRHRLDSPYVPAGNW
jgi:hypothetical protein